MVSRRRQMIQKEYRNIFGDDEQQHDWHMYPDEVIYDQVPTIGNNQNQFFDDDTNSDQLIALWLFFLCKVFTDVFQYMCLLF